MKSMIAVLAAFLAAAACPAAAQEAAPVPPKFFSSAAEVEKMIASARAEHKPHTNTIRILAAYGDYPVQLEYRTDTTRPSLHKGHAELIYVIAGGCTLVMGGTLVDAKPGPGFNMFGTSIEGGTSRKVAKGDYIMMPPDTPHQYADPDGEFIAMTIHVPTETK